MLGFGLLLPLLIVEIVLHLGHWAVGENQDLDLGSTDKLTLLCAGDSHTFGVYYPEEQSYPLRLKAHLEASLGLDTVRIVRAAQPGLGTATIRARMPELLQQHRPDFVLVLVGINNRWNRTDAELRGGRRQELWLWLCEHLRVCRALAVYLAQTEIAESTVEEAPPDPIRRSLQLQGEEWEEDVLQDLLVIAQLCHQHQARPFFLNYASPASAFDVPNRALQRAAQASSSGLIDCRQDLAGALAQGLYDRLLIPGDEHPTAEGYDQIARCVSRHLLATLGKLPGPAVEAASVQPQLILEWSPDSPLRLLLHGPPGRSYRVFLSGKSGPPIRIARTWLPIGFDALYQASRNSAQLTGQLDEQGRASVTIEGDALPSPLFAAAALLREQTASEADEFNVEEVSNAVQVSP